MKTSDGRFIEKRVKIKQKTIKIILNEVKNSNDLTWRELAKLLGICEHSITIGWLIEGNSIPLSIFKKIIKLHPSLSYKDIINRVKFQEPFWGQKLGEKSRLEKKVVLPNTKTNEFAEFFGIMLGDGCIYSNLNGFCISSDSPLDREYITNYVPRLIKRLFNLKPKIYESKDSRVINCVVYSRKLCRFLVSVGFPKGKKSRGKLQIPKRFFENERLCAFCIRGLNDTDGCVARHPHTKIMINISITYKSLNKSVINAFEAIDFPVGGYNKGINIYGTNKIKRYFELIGSSNPKHLFKYKKFLRDGKVPSSKEMEDYLNK